MKFLFAGLGAAALFGALSFTPVDAEAQMPNRRYAELDLRQRNNVEFRRTRGPETTQGVPELDPKSGASAVALLLGGSLLMIRRRRRRS